MAAPLIRVTVTGQTPRSIAGLAPLSSIKAAAAACQLKQNRVKQIMQQQGMGIPSIIIKKGVSKNKSCSPCCLAGSNSNFSPSETIEQLYTCINDNNLEQLAKLFSDDCRYNDLSFPQPFQGKKDVVRFFEQLTSVMGKNVKFKIGHVCEGDGLTAAIDWHLEWQRKQIPFTRGCSFYECAEEGQNIIIKDAKTVTESPIKPGLFGLILLKIVIKVFDDFPKATERFLKSPDAIPKTILKIYNTILKPFISPLLASYINLWKLVARLLGFTFSIICYILKIFIK